MDIHHPKEANDKLFRLLKEPLQLHDKCVNFTLECNIDGWPHVREEYYCDLDHIIKTLDHEVKEENNGT